MNSMKKGMEDIYSNDRDGLYLIVSLWNIPLLVFFPDLYPILYSSYPS